MNWNKLYNLADIIRFNYEKGLTFDKHTIAYQYVSQSNKPLTHDRTDVLSDNYIPPDIDFELLQTIVDSFDYTYEPDTFCIHFRLGDNMCDHVSSFDEILRIIHKNKLNKKYKTCKVYVVYTAR